RWPGFRQIAGGSVNGDVRDQVGYDEGDDRAPFPDIEGDRAAYEILSWDMEPGDVVVFNGRMVHGGSGNLAPDRDLKVFNTQWLGDDVRVLFRPEGMSPDHSAAMTEVGLSSGDRIGTDLYPQLWRREPIPARRPGARRVSRLRSG
ncbi:MAG: phytanoyl-CoA dioxygenase family protein, partial [Acidimicrobiales bacterium]|nr:phytanoyl-CoA dioxygenase family protein [Acidimicrobiales bacterium]